MLTVKLDDVAGRSQVNGNIIKGITTNEAYGYLESWHILLKKLNALGLNLNNDEHTANNK